MGYTAVHRTPRLPSTQKEGSFRAPLGMKKGLRRQPSFRDSIRLLDSYDLRCLSGRLVIEAQQLMHQPRPGLHADFHVNMLIR